MSNDPEYTAEHMRAFGMLGLGGRPLTEDTVGAPWIPLPESAVLAPAQMRAGGDAVIEFDGEFAEGWFDLGLSTSAKVGVGWGHMTFTNPPTKVHNCRANVAYCDGHVAGDRFKDLFAETDEASSQWNHDHRPHRVP